MKDPVPKRANATVSSGPRLETVSSDKVPLVIETVSLFPSLRIMSRVGSCELLRLQPVSFVLPIVSAVQLTVV